MSDGWLWDVQFAWNFWFSLGIHIDHRGPYITIHLPGCIITVGRLPYAMSGWSVRRGNMGNPKSLFEAVDEDGVVYTAAISNPRGGMPVDAELRNLVWRDKQGRRFRQIGDTMYEISAAKDVLNAPQ